MTHKKTKHLRGKGKPTTPEPIETKRELEQVAEESEVTSSVEENEETASPSETDSDAAPASSVDESEVLAEPSTTVSSSEAPQERSSPEDETSEPMQTLLPVVPLRSILEAVLLVSPEPVEPAKLSKTFPEFPKEEIERALEEIVASFDGEGRGLAIGRVAGGYRLQTRAEFDPWLERFFEFESEAKLSLAALETLAIVAYRQPITLPEINEIRGVSSSGVVNTLLERKLVKIHGRKPVVGSPFLYRSTRQFLEHFGLASLSDLPRPEEMEQLLGEGARLPPELMQPPLPFDDPIETSADPREVAPSESEAASTLEPETVSANDAPAAEPAAEEGSVDEPAAS